MKIFVLFVAIIINFNDGLAENTDNVRNQLEKLKMMSFKIIKEKCYVNSTEGFERFSEISINATKCVNFFAKDSSVFQYPVKIIKDNIQKCVDDLIEELEKCYSENLKDWPQLSFDIVYSYIDFLYENKEVLGSPEVIEFFKECSKEFSNASRVDEEFLPCVLDSLNSKFRDIKSACQEMIEVERCLMKQVVEKCPTEEDSVKKLIVDLLASLAQPCAEYDATENPTDNIFTLLAPYAPPNINPDLM